MSAAQFVSLYAVHEQAQTADQGPYSQKLVPAMPTPACHLQEKEPRLPTLLKLLVWAQNQLDTRCTYPRINDLAAPTLTDPMQTQ